MSETTTNNAQAIEAMKSSIPVIVCGKSFQVGEVVTKLIQPEFEAIHFVNSYEEAIADLPDLLAGRGPKSPSPNHIGTHDYSRPPHGVLFGRAFDPEHVKELNRLYRGKGVGPVAWIAGDPSVVPPANPGPGYPEKAAENVKKAFAKWKDAGAMDEDIVYY